MSLWTICVITLLLLQVAQLKAQPRKDDSQRVAIEEVAIPSEEQPRPLTFTTKDWNLTLAYSDVFRILSNQNACSSFYGGPHAATTVLNGFFSLVKSQPLMREVSFQMVGKPRLFHDSVTGTSYRLFDRTMVNSNGSFYQRRDEAMRKFPADVGAFAPGSRRARALIVLHELGHLIQGANGDWLLPDDGHDGARSKANTLRVQQVCRAQLEDL